MKRLLVTMAVVGSCAIGVVMLALSLKPLFWGDPFVMRFVRTTDREVIEVHHPKHAAPIRLAFTPTGGPLDQTILGKNSLRELPFGELVFVDASFKPGLVRLTHQGIDLYISSSALYEGPVGPSGTGARPPIKHTWGKALELDFRKPDMGGGETTPGEKANPTVPTASP